MKNQIQLTKPMTRIRHWLIPLALAVGCFALSPAARAVCQQGCSFFDFNTFLGDDALLNNTGLSNTAIGYHALNQNTSGGSNTATGESALALNTTGYSNTATGSSALYSNTTGFQNTANGLYALYFNTTGNYNTATGANALLLNTTGFYNTANGASALYSTTTGYDNTATGVNALLLSTTGHDNIAEGFNALYNNTTGSSNIALGSNAGSNLTTGSNNIDIGNKGVAGEAKTIRIGKTGTQTTTHIAGISGTTVAGGVGVIIDTNGKLGTVVSSARYKDAIKPMDRASEAILALKPVTFRYKKDLDPEGIPQFGLVAEEVAKVNPALVARDAEGEVYTVRYEAVNAMLLNEFLKEHRRGEEQDRKIQDQETTIAELRSEMKTLATTVNEQASQLQKVSAQLQINSAAAQVIAENP